MILRGNRDNKSVLVAQTDHSQLVGQMASHWGNRQFDPPKPYDSVVRAAIYHDYAWLLYMRPRRELILARISHMDSFSFHLENLS